MHARCVSGFSMPSGRLGWLISFVLIIAFAVCLGLAQSARADVIYNYAFSPGAGYSTPDSDTASLSGTFSWDATTNSIVASNISLSGNDYTGSDPGLFSCNNCSTGIYGLQNFDVNNGPQALYVIFSNALSLGASDPLALSCCSGGNYAEYQGGYPFTGVTGSADLVPVSAVPEPSSFVLFGIGAAILVLVAIRRPRKPVIV